MSTGASVDGAELRPPVTIALPPPSPPVLTGNRPGKWLGALPAWWAAASDRTRVRIQVAVVLGLGFLAFNFSLMSLLQTASLETPLAYVSLVPMIALALAWVRSKPLRPEPAIHDRELDYIIGIPLLGAAIAIDTLLPSRLSAMFWVWRIDMLTLPLFVAGAVSLIFGVRALWRQKLAIAYLLLAWPLPYTAIMLGLLNSFTSLTVAALHGLLGVLPLATASPSADGSVFTVVHNGVPFPVSIVSACSGVNSMVGFLLVGSAFAALVRGPIVRKSMWLIGGMALLWGTNLVRIMIIFWSGKVFGEHFALAILHPVLGLVTFSLGICIMLLLVRPLGMRIDLPAPQPKAADNDAATDRPAVPRIFLAASIVAVVALVLSVAQQQLRAYDLVAGGSGGAKLLSYTQNPEAPAGWTVERVANYDWAKPLFGADSTWTRFLLNPVSVTSTSSQLGSHVPSGAAAHDHAPVVVADVINSGDPSTFSAYGVDACYQFHGDSLRGISLVDLIGGIHGQSLSYAIGLHGSWSIVYWISPVKGSLSNRYERTVLYVTNSDGMGAKDSLTPADRRAINAIHFTDRQNEQLMVNRAYLIELADKLIREQAGGHRHTSSPATVASPTRVR